MPRAAKPRAFAKQKSLEGRDVVDSFFYFLLRENKKSRRRPTLARASPALPSAMESLTSVFGMGTGMTSPLWSPAKTV